jgi:acyl carrier protein
MKDAQTAAADEARDISRADLLRAMQVATAEVLGDDAPDITEQLELGSDHGIDSLDLIEVMMILEEEFDLVLEASDLDGSRTVADVLDSLEALVAR